MGNCGRRERPQPSTDRARVGARDTQDMQKARRCFLLQAVGRTNAEIRRTTPRWEGMERISSARKRLRRASYCNVISAASLSERAQLSRQFLPRSHTLRIEDYHDVLVPLSGL